MLIPILYLRAIIASFKYCQRCRAEYSALLDLSNPNEKKSQKYWYRNLNKVQNLCIKINVGLSIINNIIGVRIN